MPVPTVGRKLYYIPSESDLTNPVAMQVLVKEGITDPLDATIIAVHEERTINILVVDIFGQLFPKTNVTLYGDVTPAEGGGYAVWMPYQLGVEKEAAENKAAEPAAATTAKSKAKAS